VPCFPPERGRRRRFYSWSQLRRAVASRRSGLGLEAMLLHAIAQRVRRQAQSRRRVRDVPIGLTKRREQMLALHVAHDVAKHDGVVRAIARPPTGRRRAIGLGQSEHRDGHVVSLPQEGHAFHQVGQLADVAGPAIAQ
jgi:hypothetical protein